MRRQVSRPVRRGAGRKGRKDLARSLPGCHATRPWLSFLNLPGFMETIASLPGFGMAPVGHLSYSAGPNMRARRPQPCSVRVRIDPIPPQG
jgi:hypothetical protein